MPATHLSDSTTATPRVLYLASAIGRRYCFRRTRPMAAVDTDAQEQQ